MHQLIKAPGARRIRESLGETPSRDPVLHTAHSTYLERSFFLSSGAITSITFASSTKYWKRSMPACLAASTFSGAE